MKSSPFEQYSLLCQISGMMSFCIGDLLFIIIYMLYLNEHELKDWYAFFTEAPGFVYCYYFGVFSLKVSNYVQAFINIFIFYDKDHEVPVSSMAHWESIFMPAYLHLLFCNKVLSFYHFFFFKFVKRKKNFLPACTVMHSSHIYYARATCYWSFQYIPNIFKKKINK